MGVKPAEQGCSPPCIHCCVPIIEYVDFGVTSRLELCWTVFKLGPRTESLETATEDKAIPLKCPVWPPEGVERLLCSIKCPDRL